MDNKKPTGIVEYLLTHYRGLFATIFLLPISAVYSCYNSIRNKISFLLQSAPAKHDERVKYVQQQIEQWKSDGAKEQLCTARSAWQAMSELVPAYKKSRRNIFIDMRDVLQIDTERKVVRVEPLVNMGQITATLNPLGWTLPVVPELDGLTVGGLIMGFGVETSSHKYGLFQYICRSFEIVTAEGKLVKCSKDENAELFYSIPWSYGTLGFLVAAELDIIPAAKYVKVHYKPIKGLENIVADFDSECRKRDKNDFVECLQYDIDKTVIMTGNFADAIENDGRKNSIGKWYKPWFYTHVESYLNTGKEGTEYIPLRDYYHRHTRSLFWEMREIIPFGNHPVFRFLLGWALPPAIPLLKYTETQTTKELREKYHVVQDMLMPMKKLKSSLEYFHQHYQLYPLWLCPMDVYSNDKGIGFIHPFSENGSRDELYVDIGAYGVPKREGFDGNTALQALEQFVIANKGYQALYAKTRMTHEDLRKMFDHRHYDQLREQLPFCKQAFGEVYDKVGGKARISSSEFRGKKPHPSASAADY